MAETRYTDEEVDAILERALARDSRAGGLTHDELRAAAEEVGISHDAFESAAIEVRAHEEKSLAKNVEAFDDEPVAPNPFVRWLRHLVTYALVIGFLYVVNRITSPVYPWWMWPALGWGLGVALHLVSVIFPKDPRRREERKARRERRRDRRKERKTGKHDAAFEKNVNRAVDELVAAIHKRALGSLASLPSGKRSSKKVRVAGEPVGDDDEDETVPEKKRKRN